MKPGAILWGVWDKHLGAWVSQHSLGMGHLTRGNAENCLFATRGKPRRVDAGVSQLIVAPQREHSRKPDEARDRLATMIGNGRYIELFARDEHEGWDCWGDEIKGANQCQVI